MKYVGIDIGGMTIKGGIVDEKGNILARKWLSRPRAKKTSLSYKTSQISSKIW